MLEYLPQALKTQQPRDDYQEFLLLPFLFLGGKYIKKSKESKICVFKHFALKMPVQNVYACFVSMGIGHFELQVQHTMLAGREKEFMR